MIDDNKLIISNYIPGEPKPSGLFTKRALTSKYKRSRNFKAISEFFSPFCIRRRAKKTANLATKNKRNSYFEKDFRKQFCGFFFHFIHLMILKTR